VGVAGEDNFVNSACRSTLLDDRLFGRLGGCGGGPLVEMFVGLDGAVPLLAAEDADDANDPLPAGTSPFPACEKEEEADEELSMAGNWGAGKALLA
jgi:hypothetical protein